MIAIIFLCSVLVLFLFEVKVNAFLETALSSFWVLTYFFCLSYPVKYFIINAGIYYQAPVHPSQHFFSLSLMISSAFWYLIYFFRAHYVLVNGRSRVLFSSDNVCRIDLAFFSKAVLLLLLLMSFFSLFYLFCQHGFILSNAFYGNLQNEKRVGEGYLFIWYTLYFSCFLALLFFVGKVNRHVLFVIIPLVLCCAVLEMILLGTRRPLYLVLYALLLYFSIKQKSRAGGMMLFLYPVLMSWLSPVAQLLRHPTNASFSLVLDTLIKKQFIWSMFGSTFEGVEHLANFLQKITLKQFFLGIDHGVSWLFNVGLSFFPRVIWHSKPLFYGNVAQQKFIYPMMFVAVKAGPTYPPGMIVDALFGFGVMSAIVFAWIYARLLRYVDDVLFFGKAHNAYSVLIAAAIYISLFNFVRGGTAIVLFPLQCFAIAVLLVVVNTVSNRLTQYVRIKFRQSEDLCLKKA